MFCLFVVRSFQYKIEAFEKKWNINSSAAVHFIFLPPNCSAVDLIRACVWFLPKFFNDISLITYFKSPCRDFETLWLIFFHPFIRLFFDFIEYLQFHFCASSEWKWTTQSLHKSEPQQKCNCSRNAFLLWRNAFLASQLGACNLDQDCLGLNDRSTTCNKCLLVSYIFFFVP